MRLGVCGSMIAPSADPIGIGSADTAARLGFDYIELSLAHLAALDENAFAAVAERLRRSGIRCEACNNFFPPAVRLTGADADPGFALAYAARALGRAARLGVQVVVLGSSGAKNVPAGFPLPAARGQLLAVLHGLGPLAAEHGITIVLEPISRPEANFVNLAAEALELAQEVAHPHVQLLVDYYHLAAEAEDPGVLLRAGARLRHVHFASAPDRGFPVEPDPRAAAFFQALHASGYRNRVSIEAFTSDFGADGPRALAVLRAATGAAPPAEAL